MFVTNVALHTGWRYAGVGNVLEQQQCSAGGECALDIEELI